MTCVNKEILKDGIKELRDRNKISQDVKEAMDTYIDNISLTNVYKTQYSEFNQTDSMDVIFSDTQRSVTYTVSSDVGVILTNKISLSNILLTDLKLLGVNEEVTWSISYNGTTWYQVNSYNINERIDSAKDGFYLKIETTQTNTIYGIKIIYENLNE